MKDKLLGNRLRQLRENNGLVQRKVATYLDIDTPMYSKYERGERLPKKEQLSQLAELFNVDEKELRIIWLADKILKIMSDEIDINKNAVRLAHDNLNYEFQKQKEI